MEFMELLRARHSVRKFQEKPVTEEQVARILEAVRTAPTAGNFQSYELYVVSGKARMQALGEATFSHEWVAQAPLALVVCIHAERCQYDPKAHWALQDACVVATLAHLAIVDLGLATCWVGAFLPEKVAAVLGAAKEHVPLAILPVGYAAEAPQDTERRPLAEFVHRCE